MAIPQNITVILAPQLQIEDNNPFENLSGWWWNVPILKNDGVKVNGKDDIHSYEMEVIIHSCDY